MNQLNLQARAKLAWEKKQKENLKQEDLKIKAIVKNKLLSYKESSLTSEKREVKLIVSLTSYPARMADIHYCLYTLLMQSIKPDMLILWLAEEQFPNLENDIPEKVLKLKNFGLSIKWTKEIRSYKKLIATLKEYPKDIIVTADDDIYYDEDWLKKLYDTYLEDKESIIAHRAHKIKIENKNIVSYTSWEQTIDDNSQSYLNFATTGGGILYPPNMLYKDVLNEELFMSLCPYADDIWFWAMAVMNKKKIKVIKNPINKIKEIYYEEENATCLYDINIVENDKQLKKIIEYYPEIIEKLQEEIV